MTLYILVLIWLSSLNDFFSELTNLTPLNEMNAISFIVTECY